MPKRVKEEEMEKKDFVKNDAPESKFQESQQIDKTQDAKVEPSASTFVPKKEVRKGSQLRQEVASETIKDASYGGSNSGDGLSFAGRSVSGNAGGVSGAANATPIAGQARSTSRDGKKLDRNSTKLNYIPNDQVITQFDESKPLADAADKDQGFNGTYRNEFARLQKKAGNVPAELMFDRSLDLIEKDVLYYGNGQEVKQSGVTYDDECKHSCILDDYGGYMDSVNPNYNADAKGNYLAKKYHVSVDKNGQVRYMYFDEIEATPVVSAGVANRSSVAKKIHMNDSELVRETIDTKAGDEKADIWSPLARAVFEPTNTVGLLRDIESDTGNELMIAYRKFSTAHAFQINRAHKDGQDVIAPAIDALTGLQHSYVSKDYMTSQEGNSIANLFRKECYLRGDSQLMIALYDSTGKYNTKADILVQPRSFRMHLQTADNNMDPFKVNKRLVQAYDATECFSTVDRDYDGNLPVLMTDKAAIYHRLSWNKQYAFFRDKFTGIIKPHDNTEKTTTVLIPAIFMDNLSGLYLHCLTNTNELTGDWNIDNNGKITIDNSNEATQVKFYINNSSTAESTEDEKDYVFSLSEKPSITLYTERLVSLTVDYDAEHIYAGTGFGPYTYKYTDLRNNYAVTVKHPLLAGLEMYFNESIGGKLYSLIGLDQLNVPCVHSSKYFSLWSILLCAATPFMGKVRINSMRDVLYYEKNFEYPFLNSLIPLKDVTTKSYSNFVFKDIDHELEVGRMGTASKIKWTLPEMLQEVGVASSISSVLLPWYANEVEIHKNPEGNSVIFDDDAAAMSMPSIRSGVRLGVLDDLYGLDEKDIRLAYDMVSSFEELASAYTYTRSGVYKYGATTDGQPYLGFNKAHTSALRWLTLPRQVGYVVDAPYGLLTPKYDGNYLADDSADFIGTTSYRAQYWIAKNPVACTTGNQAILSDDQVNINRAQNFNQIWFMILSNGASPTTDHGMLMSANQLLSSAGALLPGRATFTPYKNMGGINFSTNMNSILSLQKYLWTRIQKLPFIISPFDVRQITNNSDLVFDQWDLAIMFGLAGFRASDFRESIYNREKEVVNQGILFVNDPWVESSLLFREGSSSSGLKVSKGFEMK